MKRNALIAGASGIVGNNLARHLVSHDWTVNGLARRPVDIAGVLPVPADLLNPDDLERAFADLQPTHVFIASWMRQATEAENCAVNGGMVRNLLTALDDKPIEHVALITGLKHYLGPFESYGEGTLPPTPFREDLDRLPIPNFYYDQEDALFESASRQGFGWSVHRPHTIVGFAHGNAMNMGVTLAVYATICRELGRPFTFPGSPQQWSGLTDVTDARLLARHLEWASITPSARDQAFNIVNGDVFRWSWMWPRIAAWFGIEKSAFPDQTMPLEIQMREDGPIWATIAKKFDLVESDLEHLISPWHTDADLGRPIEVVTDMSKSRRFGFLDYQPSDESFFSLFEDLRGSRFIP